MLPRTLLSRFLLTAGLILAALLLPAAPVAAAPEIAAPFRAYYAAHEGLRVLGHPLSGLHQVGDCPAQIFEKGRIEDHRMEVQDPAWAFMYGRLTAELMVLQPQGAVSGTRLTYGDLARAADPQARHPMPDNFRGGTLALPDSHAVFVPFDPWLRPAPGYAVPDYFWAYMNRRDLFPGGWLHDIGLPMTALFYTQVPKNGISREIVVQAFERSVLSYDPLNPAGWQVERGNIGADALATPLRPTAISIPTADSRVMLPLHLLARLGQPADAVTAVLQWQDGTQLTNSFTLLRGEDGQGLLIGNLDWINQLQPPQPRTQPASLEIRSAAGAVLARQPLIVVSANDADTQAIQVYWSISGTDDMVQPQTRRILRTTRPGTAALEELLWGPPAISQVGFRTALPTPEQVLSYPGRAPGWGPRVVLRSLAIVDGVATADFSQELKSYGGGSTRVHLIREQITRTLRQFPTVREVRIAIEGQTDGVLEP